ncbi:hypothetical protein M758_8G033400 [Ceratodon purpureus]|nr:hypothetical protein M758_8G033400 [Ceratodon purpureus]
MSGLHGGSGRQLDAAPNDCFTPPVQAPAILCHEKKYSLCCCTSHCASTHSLATLRSLHSTPPEPLEPGYVAMMMMMMMRRMLRRMLRRRMLPAQQGKWRWRSCTCT